MTVPAFMGPLGNRRVKQIVIPGSHDAGLVDAFQAPLVRFGATKAKTVTQDKTIGQQAGAGSRFFDVRIQKIGNELKAFHTAPNPLRHVPLVNKIKATHTDTKTFGAAGQDFASILDELKTFVASNLTEFVMVRLSHLKDTGEVFTDLKDWIAANPTFVYKGTGNLANKLVSDLAGKVVLIVEDRKFKNRVDFGDGQGPRSPTQADGFHRFYQSKGGNLPVADDGLCVCGEFSNKKKLEDIMVKQLTNYTTHDKHKNHRNDQAHLYSLYWTATGGDIHANTQQLDTANFARVRAAVNDKIQANWGAHIDSNVKLGKLKLDADDIRQKFAIKATSIPNIVLYDFINDGMSNAIIALNDLAGR